MARFSQILLVLGAAFLGYESVQALQSQAYWDLFKNLIFMAVMVYMTLIYPNRKLKLNQDLMKILAVYFMGLTLRGLLLSRGLDVAIGMAFMFAIMMYGIYRRKYPYSIHLSVKKRNS